ncbi:hypothetical protein [Actinophytocola gossypii]|uniref:SPW repeat-containing protein n=1 Tax=Actinophytocola gossypii TaxID=2812003 RepID=A0ABT2J5A6_9PSEU|nr:hypothetical protein [Actinophytocola gossypii]MCT2582946.1 hypothetical protein [Actinophytocola gossypii]
MRVVLAVLGVAALAWGAWLAVESVSVPALLWFAGGPVVHDAVVAPLVGVVGLAVARFVPERWRAPVAVGAVSSGVLVVLAVPLLWRPYGVPENPGLHDRDYVLGLAVALGVVWVGVLVSGLARPRRRGTSRRR